jgi:hypothetical protein
MSSRRGSLNDDLDRAVGQMMANMPLEYRLEHGRTCSSTSKRVTCGHVTKIVLERPKDCWLCAVNSPYLCQPVTVIENSIHIEACPRCTAYEAGATEYEMRKATAKERKMQLDRERSAVNRAKRNEEQDRKQAETHCTSEMRNEPEASNQLVENNAQKKEAEWELATIFPR